MAIPLLYPDFDTVEGDARMLIISNLHRLFGCYEALDGGDLGEALEDFTGGVSESISLVELGVADKPEERATLFARLQKEVERKSLLAASIPVSSTGYLFILHLEHTNSEL